MLALHAWGLALESVSIDLEGISIMGTLITCAVRHNCLHEPCYSHYTKKT
jgi:hypothetical protein